VDLPGQPFIVHKDFTHVVAPGHHILPAVLGEVGFSLRFGHLELPADPPVQILLDDQLVAG